MLNYIREHASAPLGIVLSLYSAVASWLGDLRDTVTIMSVVVAFFGGCFFTIKAYYDMRRSRRRDLEELAAGSGKRGKKKDDSWT